MSFFIYLVMLLILIYSLILIVTLWKKGEKAGGIAVALLIIFTLAVPFFSVLKIY